MTISPIVFSTLFNESKDFLEILIKNFLIFSNEEDFFVINIGTSDLDIHVDLSSERIHFVKSNVERKKWGATLLNGHVENFQFSKTLFQDQDFLFCTTASNSLFIKRYEKSRIIESLVDSAGKLQGVSLGEIGGWWWERIKKSDSVCSLLNNKSLVSSQIEGLLTYSENWDEISNLMPRLISASEGITDSEVFPMEEFIPSTIIANSKKNNLIHVCKVMWERFQSGHHLIEINEIYSEFDAFPDQKYINIAPETIFMCKWFMRTSHSLPTVILGDENLHQSFGYLNELLNLNINKNRFIFECIKFLIDRDFSYTPIKFNENKYYLDHIDAGKFNLFLENKDVPIYAEFFNSGSPEDHLSFQVDIIENIIKIKTDYQDNINSRQIGILFLPLIEFSGSHYLIKYDKDIGLSRKFSHINNSRNMDSFDFSNSLVGFVHIGKLYRSKGLTYLGLPIVSNINEYTATLFYI